MAIVDRAWIAAFGQHTCGKPSRSPLGTAGFDFYMIEAKPENLIGDRAYDSDPLDDELRRDGIEMIAPHRCNRSKSPTQDRRRLSRYMRRWLVERFFAWIQWQRRIVEPQLDQINCRTSFREATDGRESDMIYVICVAALVLAAY